MNSSKTNEILKDIKTNTSELTAIRGNSSTTITALLDIEDTLNDTNTLQTTMNSKLSENTTYNENSRDTLSTIDTTLDSIDSYTAGNQSILINNGTRLYNIEEDLTTINNTLVDIGVSLNNTAPENRVFISGRLTDGTNEYLDTIDYTSSPINFSWTNTFDKPVYIDHYRVSYKNSDQTEPQHAQLYHSTAWDMKIGKMNDTGDDYLTHSHLLQKNNLDYVRGYFNNPKQTIYQDNHTYNWEYDFSKAPIEIGVSKKFGQYIAGDFSDADIYTTAPVGLIRGYYIK